tara:strand:- start:30 stop:1457 length:1428 start_codon:yes stop_codon:yes gene_type:complete
MALIGWGRTAKPGTHFGNDKKEYRYKAISSGPCRNEKYFTLVNKETGQVEIYNNDFYDDTLVGYYNPKTKETKITPWARECEKEAFGDPESGALENVIKNSKNMIEKECFNDATMKATGVSEADRQASCKKLANDLLNDGTSLIDPLEADTMRGVAEEQQEKLMEVKGRKTFPNLRYPEKMSEDQDAIKFTVLEFQPREWDETQPGVLKERNRGDASLEKIGRGSVILPMPGGIKDNNQQDWGNGTMNPLEAVGAQLALAAFQGSNEVGSLLKNVANDLGASDMDETAQSLIAGQVSGVGGQLIKRQGALINPNVELLFNAPQLRSFNFTFNLSPRNPKEAQTVKQIIRTFKQASAPRRTIKGYFLRTPLIYRIDYINNAYNLNRFKECAMTSFQTDYTPNGNYSTFRDGTMTQYKISMAFSEIDPIFNDDYDALDADNESNPANEAFFNDLAASGNVEIEGTIPDDTDSAGIGY